MKAADLSAIGENVKVGIEKTVDKTKDLTAGVGEGLERRFDAARRTMRKAQRIAEDRIEERRYQIKKNPVRSVVIAASAGIGIGFLAGWLARGRGRAA